MAESNEPVDSERASGRDRVFMAAAVAVALPWLFLRFQNYHGDPAVIAALAGLAIVGDNERAAEARKIFDYYADLVTEIKLETRIDGNDRVGTGEPFGVFVNIVHTR